MRLIVTTFVGVVFGFFLGVSFPTLTLTKVQKLFVYMVVFLPHSIPMISTRSNGTFFCTSIWQMNLPTSLFPSIDLTYIEDKYAGLSSQALLNALSSLKGNSDTSTYFYRYNDTEVGSLKLFALCSIIWFFPPSKNLMS